MSRTVFAAGLLMFAHSVLQCFAQSPITAAQASPAEPARGFSATGVVNVVSDCGAVGDGVTDDWKLIQACIDNHPGKTIFLPKMRNVPCDRGSGGGCIGSVDYYVSRTLKLNGNAQALVGDSPSRWPGGAVQIKFPRDLNEPGIWIPATVYSGYVGNLFLNGQRCWNSTDLSTFDQPLSLTGIGPDGLLVTGGEPTLYGVTAYCFGRHGFAVFGNGSTKESAPSQPDFWSIQNSFAIGNRAYGAYIDGADSNAGESIALKTTGNQLGGIYDHSVLGNTHISPASHMDNRGAVPAGAKHPIQSLAVENHFCTLTLKSDEKELTAKDTWITVSGTSDPQKLDGTYRLAPSSTTPLTLGYSCDAPSGTRSTVGSVARASSTEVYQTYRDKGFPTGSFIGRSNSSVDVWINPYCESNSGPPNFGYSSLVLGRSCEVNATGDRTWNSWIPGPAWSSTMRVGYGLALDNGSDIMNWLTIRAGRTKDQYKGIRFAGPEKSYWDVAQAADSYFFIRDDESKGFLSLTLNKGGTTDISAPNNSAVRLGRGSTGGVQFFGETKEVASVDAKGKATFAGVCLSPGVCWSAGAGPPPPGTCSHGQGGSLYTRSDSSAALYVCNGSTGTWVAK